ncbi:HET-domain-containing protein [Venturia nashicola]|uniref:HET-domain-containing protein n=1 Tax=Venturia nashicola TaxID=86259 RepID=A0A4Z1PRH3_9PEZI|nr:HET-domain-containing protein [Venturia nashicola]
MQSAVRSMNLAHHPYWSRLWIVQEVMFAVNLVVRFGSLREDWSTFTTMIKARGANTSPALKVIKHKEQFYDGNPKFHQNFLLYSLMSEFRHSQARIIHDKVYAPNGLATQETRVQVDYTISELCLALRVLETITSRTNSGITDASMDRKKAIAFLIRALELNQRDASRLKRLDTER